MNVKASWSLRALQDAVEEISGLPSHVQCLYVQGKPLVPDRSLGEQGVQNRCVVDVRCRVGNMWSDSMRSGMARSTRRQRHDATDEAVA